jgi:hypothetical protein
MFAKTRCCMHDVIKKQYCDVTNAEHSMSLTQTLDMMDMDGIISNMKNLVDSGRDAITTGSQRLIGYFNW